MLIMFGDISEIDLIEICAIFLITPFIGVIFFEKVRSRFPIKVNCWFCNSYLYVGYQERYCFTCTSCRQYNGFNPDGSYNKPMPEQYDDLLNPQPIRVKKKGSKNNQVQGKLCKLCNNNQQLKIYQLANFIPLNEENYDMEIEHFQKQLERAYTLCHKCNKVLEKTIKQQTQRLMGQKMLHYRKKGLDNSISENTKRNYIITLYKITSLPIILISLVSLIVYDIGGVKHLLQRFSSKHQLTYSMVATSFYSIGVMAVIISWLYVYKKLSHIKLNQNQIKTESLKHVVKKEKLSDSTSSINTQLNSTDISTNSIESLSDYEDFSQTIQTRKKKSTKLQPIQKPIPIFGEKALLRNSLNESKSPLSFKELNQSKFDFNQSKVDLTKSFVSLDNSFNSSKSLNEFNINTGQFTRVKQPTVLNPQELNTIFSNLHLTSNSLITKPILSPSKLNNPNPWSGFNSKIDIPSRSSSQSSGIFSTDNFNSLPNSCASSINGDVDNNSIIGDATFVCNKKVPNYFRLSQNSTFCISNRNNLSFTSDVTSGSGAFTQPRTNVMNHYADMHPFNTSFNASNF